MKHFARIVSFIAIIFLSPSCMADGDKPLAVLVTGASSGIGLRITEVMSQNGYFVYAGARKKEDLKRLEAMENVESVRLDVTVPAQIDAAVELIKSRGRGLHGLVNNAGVVTMGPLIEVPVSELQWIFDVNVYGPYRVTQAFAPLIIKSKGRIVNISSIHGVFSDMLAGHYSMSKHAIEAYTDSLAAEMERFGVGVSVIEPSSYASRSGKSAVKRFEKKFDGLESSAYVKELEFLKMAASIDTAAPDPKEVAEAVVHAIFSKTPKRRYLVASNKIGANMAMRGAMKRLLQLNQEHPFTMTREQLIELMDKELLK